MYKDKGIVDAYQFILHASVVTATLSIDYARDLNELIGESMFRLIE